MWDINKKIDLSDSPGLEKIRKELSKFMDTNSKDVSDILDLPNHTKLSVSFPDEAMEVILEISEKLWKTPEEIISDILHKWTRSILAWSKTDQEIKNILWEISIENLENEVLRFVWKNTLPFSSWTEADVFKMNVPWNDKELLLVKRKYEWTSESEFSMHHIAKDIQNSFHDKYESNVFVPTPIHHFHDEKNEYILMEFIRGKTLHLMLLESILKQETVFLWEKIQNEDLRKNFYYNFYCYQNRENEIMDESMFYSLSINEILDLISDENWYIKDFEFICDEEWSEALLWLYRILKEDGIKVDYDPDWLDEMGVNTYVNNLIHNKINISDLSKVWLFTTEESSEIVRDLDKFLSFMHKNWLYHVDLWENARNIMFTKKTDWWYRIDIIDFWRSKYFPLWVTPENIYEDQVTWVKYIRDENIVSRIFSYWKIDNLKIGKINDKDKQNTLLDLLMIWSKLWISEDQIKYNFNFYWKSFEWKTESLNKILKDILASRKNIRWYELNLSVIKNDKLKQLERDKENDIVKAEILVLMYLGNLDYNTFSNYIDNLDFKVSRKKDYIKMYHDILDMTK